MKRPTVLIVDDESYIREFLAQILSEHFRIAFAKDGKEAIEIAKSAKPAVIVLDVLMPGQNGIETCKKLREQRESEGIPVIMLTAVNEPEQRIKAFNAGADDYLAKPFLPEELIARINRKLEKTPARQPVSKENEFRLGNLKLQFDDLSIEVDGVKCELGQVEYKILNFLLKKRGELVSRQELNDYVWGDELPSDRALDPHITALRKNFRNLMENLKPSMGRATALF